MTQERIRKIMFIRKDLFDTTVTADWLINPELYEKQVTEVDLKTEEMKKWSDEELNAVYCHVRQGKNIDFCKCKNNLY